MRTPITIGDRRYTDRFVGGDNIDGVAGAAFILVLAPASRTGSPGGLAQAQIREVGCSSSGRMPAPEQSWGGTVRTHAAGSYRAGRRSPGGNGRGAGERFLSRRGLTIASWAGHDASLRPYWRRPALTGGRTVLGLSSTGCRGIRSANPTTTRAAPGPMKPPYLPPREGQAGQAPALRATLPPRRRGRLRRIFHGNDEASL